MIRTAKNFVRTKIPGFIDKLQKYTSEDAFYPKALLHRDMRPYLEQVMVGRTRNPVSSPAPSVEGDVARCVNAYQRSIKEQADLGNSMWKAFFTEKHRVLHDIFMSGDLHRASDILADPESSELFYGFSMCCRGLYDRNTPDTVLRNGAIQYLDWMLCLAEHVGVIRIHNPEQPRANYPTIDELFEKLDAVFGFRIDLPNPYPNEAGLVTSRGILTDRVPMALYQAWRTKQLTAGISNPRVLEIGAGQGLGAYYAFKMGMPDYAIVDIPISEISSGSFLMKMLGPDAVCLAGETSTAPIKFLTPQQFLERESLYNLVLNVDSFTEMDEAVADVYFKRMQNGVGTFLSINHEANRHTVWQRVRGMADRTPLYIRKGYVEETVRF